MAEENKDNTEKKHSSKKDTYLIIGAFALMVVAIFTIWQVLLKGKMDEEISKQKDTVVQVKVDTVKVKDSLKNTRTQLQSKEVTEQKQDTTNTKPGQNNLTNEQKSNIKEKIGELPRYKKERIKKNLKSKLSN
jgi:hypothetical protein